MSSSLVINASGSESRVALIENGQISEFYLERNAEKGIVGNIYKGRVVRVLPGMQAAFVDIGLDKAAFLYVSDVYYDPDFSERQFELTEGEHPEAEGVPDEYAAAMLARDDDEDDEDEDDALVAEAEAEAEPDANGEEAEAGEEADAAKAEEGPAAEAAGEEAAPAPAPKPKKAAGSRRAKSGGARKEKKERPSKEVNIQDLLKEGQEVIVQVAKDPIGTKGARITSHISIPGRHLVFMPTVDHVGISRRIDNEKERRRLREIVDELRPEGTGFIVRTVADGVPAEKLQADARFLIHIWSEIVRKKDKAPAASLLHPDLDIVLRATRDLFSADVEKLIIDDRAQYERIMRFVQATDPALASHVEYYAEPEPIFDAFGIEHEIQRAQQRKVWLKSGGYLIVDQAEALTAIDVNSGRYVGKQSLEETITKINVEAAKEIVYQLRLRNIGGIIIIDFIDMDKGQNRDKVFKALQEALGRDKAKTNVLKISELGLVEMTRKRVRESIGRMLNEPCPYCEGRGHVKSRITVAQEIFRDIRREASAFRESTIAINCHPEVARVLQNEEREALRFLMDKYNKTITVKGLQHYHLEQYDLYGKQEKKEARGGPQQARAEKAEKPEGGEKGGEKREGSEKREGRRGRGGRGRGGDRQGGAKAEGAGSEGKAEASAGASAAGARSDGGRAEPKPEGAASEGPGAGAKAEGGTAEPQSEGAAPGSSGAGAKAEGERSETAQRPSRSPADQDAAGGRGQENGTPSPQAAQRTPAGETAQPVAAPQPGSGPDSSTD